MPVRKLSRYKVCGGVDSTVTGKLLYLILYEIANKNGEIIIPQKKNQRCAAHFQRRCQP